MDINKERGMENNSVSQIEEQSENKSFISDFQSRKIKRYQTHSVANGCRE